MAFMWRGRTPNLEKGNNVNNYYRRRRRYFGRYVVLDSNYLLTQIILTFIILVLGVIAYITNYKSSIIDPIAEIKEFYINCYMITIVVFAISNVLLNYLVKTEEALIKILSIFGIISVLTMFIFLGIRMNCDKEYTKTFFAKQYSNQNLDEEDEGKLINGKLDFGIGGVTVKSNEQYYIDECQKLYDIFKSKTYGLLGIHLLFNFLLFYQIYKNLKNQKNKSQMDKNDAILFDEEQNIKI